MIWNAEKIAIKDLKEYEHNPRKISKDALDKLIKHIKQDGYHQRIICNLDNTIIGGHQRKKALLESGYKETDVIEVLKPQHHLSSEELDRINIRDNLSFGEFDIDILQSRFDPIALQEIGLDDSILKNLVKLDSVVDKEEDAEIQCEDTSTTQIGDLFILGEHRLLCGDSTNAEHVSKVLKDNSPILMVTDPPYGANYSPKWRNDSLGHKSKNTWKVLNDHIFDWTDSYSLFTGKVAYVWHRSSYTHKIAEHLEKCGFELINLIIWRKSNFTISRGDYHHHYEPCWYVAKGNHNWQGARDQSTVWDINNLISVSSKDEDNAKIGHGTQKPLECMLRPILNNSKIGDYIYDPFGGSGTTLIACEKAKRRCLMIELNPVYVDAIVKRWERITGKKAIKYE